MAIQAKQATSSIVQKYVLNYSADVFESQKEVMFQEVTAEQALKIIKPCEFWFLPGRKFISVDTETYYTGVPSSRMPSHVVRRWIKKTSKEIPNDFPFCLTICDGTNAVVIYDTLDNQFQEFKKLEVLLNDRGIDKVLHNADYDLHMIMNAGIKMCGRIWDTMFLSKLVRADAFTHNLLDIAKEIQPKIQTITKFEHMVDSYKQQHRIVDYRKIPKELMTQYTCADTWNTIKVFEFFYPKLAEMDLEDLYNLENEVMIVAFSMERTGVKIDENYKDILIPELEAEVNDAEREIYETAGVAFNINSGPQLYLVLNQLGFGHLVKINRKTGNPVFNAVAMEELQNYGVPLVEKIQRYKASLKLLNTFAVKLYEMCDADDVVHCNINSIEAKTGRWSISSPSMQNMPRRKDSRVRDAFIAPDGYVLYDFDFKSQEAIILVHYSRAQYLQDIVNGGGDIHRAIAGLIYSCAYDEVTKQQREAAKSVEFAMIYGAGAAKVITMPGMEGVTLGEANQIISKFMHNIPEVASFIKVANKKAKEVGCIKTIKGRRVYVERNREYACVNYVIQGSAADSTKSRLVALHKFLKANGFKSRMILQVHDSLLYIIHKDEEAFILPYLRWLQIERELFRVPVLVDVSRCANTWRVKEELDIPAIEPPKDMLDKMDEYDLWSDYLVKE